MEQKRFLFLNRKPPCGSAHAAEALEAALLAAAFGQEVHLAFIDDGVFQLLRGQAAGAGSLADSLALLDEADIEQVWVERQSLAERGLTEADLAVPATIADRSDLALLIAGMDIVCSA